MKKGLRLLNTVNFRVPPKLQRLPDEEGIETRFKHNSCNLLIVLQRLPDEEGIETFFL